MISPLTIAAAGTDVGVGGSGVGVDVGVGWRNEITEQAVRKVRRKGNSSFRFGMGLIIPEGGRGGFQLHNDVTNGYKIEGGIGFAEL